MIPRKPQFGQSTIASVPRDGEHDFRPPLVKIGPNVYSQTCVRCGELAVYAGQFCKGSTK